MSGVTLHSSLETPDWASLRLMAQETAAERLTAILASADRMEKQVYALRGMAMLIVEERELFRWVIDEEVGSPFQSFDRWLKQTCPESWSYCRQALNTIKELRETPFEDLLQITRANLEQLKKVSSGVRLLPGVVNAAKSMPEREFVEKMNRDHSQHLETRKPIVMAEASVSSKIDEAVEMATVLYGCKCRSEALEAVCEDFILAHQDMVDGDSDKEAG
jgi:hypothetical protein